MANKNIKGITIELGGDSTGLQKALKTVDSTSVKLNSELKEVNKLLKFDPSNTELVAQKQKLLTDSIENTSTKLDQLKSAQSQVEAQFKSGNIGEEQYRAFAREVAQTEQSLNSYKSQLSGLQSEQQKLGQNTDRLNTYFSASGKSVNDFADILGTRLVNAIRNGTATSDQLEIALNKIGKEALGADADISKFKSIKGLFNFSLKFPSISIPHIPLPHFSLSGSFNPLKGQIPSIGIDWYAKGGILTKPTIFGANGNSLMVGGEAGKEAVAPLSDLMAYVERAVSNQIGGMEANFAQMIQLLTIIASKDMSLNMDGKSVMEIIDGHMNTQQQQLDFGVGRT